MFSNVRILVGSALLNIVNNVSAKLDVPADAEAHVVIPPTVVRTCRLVPAVIFAGAIVLSFM